MGRTNRSPQRAIADRVRQDEALALRRAGLQLSEIARRLKYADASGAWRAVQAALDRQPYEDAQKVRQMELERLDEMLAVAWEQVHRDHVTVSDGRVVKDDDGVPIIDHGPKMAALDRVLKVMERRSRLLGLDAPTRKVVEVVTADVVESEIRRLEAQLGENDVTTGH